jgi:hypothetical protein
MTATMPSFEGVRLGRLPALWLILVLVLTALGVVAHVAFA